MVTSNRILRTAFDRRSLLRGVAAAGVMPLAGSRLARGAAAQGDPIRVGAIIPFTGLETHNGLSMQYGLEIGTEEINAAGGLAGRQVEIIMEDDGSDVGRGVRAAAKLVGQDNVDFLNGTLTSSVRTAVFEETRKTETLFLNPTYYEGLLCDTVLLQQRSDPQPGYRADGGVCREEPRQVVLFRRLRLHLGHRIRGCRQAGGRSGRRHGRRRGVRAVRDVRLHGGHQPHQGGRAGGGLPLRGRPGRDHLPQAALRLRRPRHRQSLRRLDRRADRPGPERRGRRRDRQLLQLLHDAGERSQPGVPGNDARRSTARTPSSAASA